MTTRRGDRWKCSSSFFAVFGSRPSTITPSVSISQNCTVLSLTSRPTVVTRFAGGAIWIFFLRPRPAVVAFALDVLALGFSGVSGSLFMVALFTAADLRSLGWRHHPIL